MKSKIEGLTVDSAALGAGLYKIICARGEAAIVSVGMIPKWAIDCFESQLRAKLTALAAPAVKLTDEELNEMMRPIVREVCTEIYAAAAKAGAMIV